MSATNVSNPILTIDLTDDDLESAGTEIWSDVSSDVTAPGESTSSPVPGTSTSDDATSSYTGNVEWESKEYMNFLKEMQDAFNAESDGEGDDVVLVEDTPAMPSFQDVASSSFNVNSVSVAGSSMNDHNNNPGTSKETPIRNSTDFPVFEMIEKAPTCHNYFKKTMAVSKKFLAAVNRDQNLLQRDLPTGIYVKMFEDRLDLISALIEGPTDTPYEGCLFYFDIQLKSEHPNKPPLVHFHSYSHKRLNPNLYTTGLVCLSLLGTWSGKKTENWTPKSTIFQLLISIQGLILVPEPFYNEPGYYEARASKRYLKEAADYNAAVIAFTLESMYKQIQKPPEVFKEQILAHYQNTAHQTIQRIESYFPRTDVPKRAKVELPFSFNDSVPQIKISLKVFQQAVAKLKDDTKM